MIRKNSKINFKKKDSEPTKPFLSKKEKLLVFQNQILDLEDKKQLTVLKDRDESSNKQTKALQMPEIRKKTKLPIEVCSLQTKMKIIPKAQQTHGQMNAKNEIELSDVTVQRIAQKKLSNAKSLKKNAPFENQILLRKKSCESFKLDVPKKDNAIQRRETNSSLKTNNIPCRKRRVDNIRIQKEGS